MRPVKKVGISRLLVYNIMCDREKSTIISEKKREIRKEILRRLRDQDPLLREERSRIIQEKLLSSDEFRASKTVMTYVSLPTEVNTRYFLEEALKRGKRVAVPYIGAAQKAIIAAELITIEHLEEGPFGIWQPKNDFVKETALKGIDLVIVPAIAYDRKNVRLGRGHGYYDRFLGAEDLSSAVSIGLAFDFQVVDSLPSDVHDQPVSKVITN